MTQQINFIWRCQPRYTSKLFLTIKYLQSQGKENRNILIQKAVDAFYYPLAYSFFYKSLKKPLAFESLLDCVKQMEQICLETNISPQALQHFLASYFELEVVETKSKAQEIKPTVVEEEDFDPDLLCLDNFMIKREF